MLKKYIPDPSHVLEAPTFELQEDLSFKVQLVGVNDREMKRLRSKVIPMVKVLWRSDSVEKMTWETEVFYEEPLSLFFLSLARGNFEDKFFFKKGRIVKPVIF